MPRAFATEAGRRLNLVVLGALCAAALLPAMRAEAADVDGLRAKVGAARGEASDLAAQLGSAREQLADAEARAAAAAAHEQRLTALLANGQERGARLGAKVALSERRLAQEKRRLRRARGGLARRLVAIYVSGAPSTVSVVLESTDLGDLTTRAGYLRQIENSDEDLAQRVEQVRDAVHRELSLVAELKARADAYNERLAVARSEVSAVRESAAAAANQQDSIAAAREASLAELKGRIGGWVEDIEAARVAEARAASQAAAEATVERWLGGPYSIPAYIVICESGGDYSALNPSSGAGGAYQILPSTWALYGGQGAPQDAPKAEQDRIAAEIWADSGPGAWSCA